MGIVELRVGERVDSLCDTLLSSWAYDNVEQFTLRKISFDGFKSIRLSMIANEFLRIENIIYERG